MTTSSFPVPAGVIRVPQIRVDRSEIVERIRMLGMAVQNPLGLFNRALYVSRLEQYPAQLKVSVCVRRLVAQNLA